MTSDEKAIRDLVARWHSATAADDVDTVLGLMAEDVVFLVVGHAPMRGRSAFESGLRKLLRPHRVESTGEVQEIEVRAIGNPRPSDSERPHGVPHWQVG